MKIANSLSSEKGKFLAGLALAGVLTLGLCLVDSGSRPEVRAFGDLRHEGLRFASADLVTKSNEVYVVVTLEWPKEAWRALRPGRRAYAFDKTGRLVAITANDVEDPEFYLEWEDPQKRALTEEEIAGLSTATGREFTEIVTGWRRVAASR